MNVDNQLAARSPLERAGLVEVSDPGNALDTLGKLRHHIAVRTVGEAVARAGLDRIPIDQVRKAKKPTLRLVYDENANKFSMDAGDLHRPAKAGDVAWFDENDTLLGYASPADAEAFAETDTAATPSPADSQQAPPAAPAPTVPAADAVPTADQVRKARWVVNAPSDLVTEKELEHAVRVLRKFRDRNAAR